jgi:4-amino-4-deoxy-L-arabinose transferase-like glycosyltransferase
MLAKLWQGQNRGMLPPGLHLLAFPLLFFPYALFTFFSIPDVLKNRHDPAIKFCLGWIVPAWLVFELSLTKLPHYVLPAYPAIALLTAKYLTDGFPALGGAKHRLPISLIVGLWLALGTGFAFFFSGILPHLSDRTVELPELVAAVVLILAQGAALILFFTKKTASLVILTISGLIFLPTTLGYTLPHLRHIWLSREIVETATAVRPCPQSQIVSVGYHEPSLVFMAGTGTILAKTAAEAAEALKQDDCRIAVVADSNKQDFLDAFPKDGPKPQEVGSIEGLDAGRGKRTSVSVLTMVKP